MDSSIDVTQTVTFWQATFLQGKSTEGCTMVKNLPKTVGIGSLETRDFIKNPGCKAGEICLDINYFHRRWKQSRIFS